MVTEVSDVVTSDVVANGAAQDEGDVNNKAVKGKRKADTVVETTPTKKAKVINDGFCLFVGNLNSTKKADQVRDSLAQYFMTQSLLFEKIRLDHSKKFAYIDFTSEMDLTKALTLNGEKFLDKPMRIAKAKIKVKEEDKVKVKPPPKSQEEKDANCLVVCNLPHSVEKAEILKAFHNAVSVKFPGQAKGPTKGTAFIRFKTKEIAEEALKEQQGLKIRDNVVKLRNYREKCDSSGGSAPAKDVSSTTLFVKNLAFHTKEDVLKNIFKKSVGINIPKLGGKSKGFAFVEFATADEAKEAMEFAQKKKVYKRLIEVEFAKTPFCQEVNEVLLTSLIVTGLAGETNETTLKDAFEGSTSARITLDKRTGVSKGYGFVDFANEDDCKAAKEAMVDCEIDGKKINLAFAKPKKDQGSAKVKPGGAGQAGGDGDGSAKKRKSRKKRKGGSRHKKVAQGIAEETEVKE